MIIVIWVDPDQSLLNVLLPVLIAFTVDYECSPTISNGHDQCSRAILNAHNQLWMFMADYERSWSIVNIHTLMDVYNQLWTFTARITNVHNFGQTSDRWWTVDPMQGFYSFWLYHGILYSTYQAVETSTGCLNPLANTMVKNNHRYPSSRHIINTGTFAIDTNSITILSIWYVASNREFQKPLKYTGSRVK